MFRFKYYILVFVVLIVGCVLPCMLNGEKTTSTKTDERESDKNYCEKDGCDTTSKQKPKTSCKTFKVTDFGPDSPTIMYGGASGRLGNQLLSYAALLELQHQLGVKSYIDAECRDYMSEYFTPESVELPVLSEVFCNPEDIPFEAYNGHIKFLLTDEKYRKGKFLHFYPPLNTGDEKNRGGYKPEDHISKEQETLQNGYVKRLIEKLKFRPHINTRVRKTLKRIAKKMGKKSKEMTYVGIHNRRTDHLEFMKKTTDLKPITIDFFYDAMEYFRDEYENVAFVFVSDDMEWGRKNLKSEQGDLFFVGAGENLSKSEKEIVEDVSYDLALLMNCNHTVITRGTFSMWAAMLAGGEFYTEYGTIVPESMMYPGN